MLTHRYRVMYICDTEWCIYASVYWFRQWLVTWLAPSHYLNQCYNIVNWILGNKLQWNFNQNQYIFIQENAFENVCKLASISSPPQWLNPKSSVYIVYHLSHMYNIYRQVSNIRRTLVGNSILDHSDVVGATPVGAAQLHLHSARRDAKRLSLAIWCSLY